jgi:hypothetical protein
VRDSSFTDMYICSSPASDSQSSAVLPLSSTVTKEKGKLGGEVARKRKRLDQDKLIGPVEGEYAQKRRKGV